MISFAQTEERQKAVSLLSKEYQTEVLSALKKSGRNASELICAIEKAPPQQREGLAFLIANMPQRDLASVKSDFLFENNDLAYQALNEAPWGKNIPQEIFLNDILPYASLNERRDSWRKDFYQRFSKVLKRSKSIAEAVGILNRYVFETLKVSYSTTKTPKPDQSPYESMKSHYATCTGLSILLTDALRSVGIPARIAGIAMWSDASGNHTWVEIWDGSWHYIGAAEPSALDHTWFTAKASLTDPQHPIYAASFRKTGLRFPLRWAHRIRYVCAVDVTGRYRGVKDNKVTK